MRLILQPSRLSRVPFISGIQRQQQKLVRKIPQQQRPPYSTGLVVLRPASFSCDHHGYTNNSRNSVTNKYFSTNKTDKDSSSEGSQIVLEHSTNENIPNAIITTLTMNRPKANAMGNEMLSALEKSLGDLEISDARCVILTSFSNKVFSAGADLKERATMTQDEAATFVTRLRNTMQRLSELPMPVIAAVEGVAVGGGLEIALAADLRIASRTATLGLPETTLAIIPGAGGTQRLPRLVGVSKAKELIWTGQRLTGDEALEIGLVDQVVEPGLTLEAATEWAWKIAKQGPIAIRASKLAIEKGLEALTMKEALEIERQNYARVLPTEDRLEGLKAFKEQRTPEYKGK